MNKLITISSNALVIMILTFSPYLLNVRGLSHTEAHGIIMEWLKECDKLRRLDFTPSYKIKGALSSSRDFLPVSCEKLKTEDESFYVLLIKNRVLEFGYT